MTRFLESMRRQGNSGAAHLPRDAKAVGAAYGFKAPVSMLLLPFFHQVLIFKLPENRHVLIAVYMFAGVQKGRPQIFAGATIFYSSNFNLQTSIFKLQSSNVARGMDRSYFWRQVVRDGRDIAFSGNQSPVKKFYKSSFSEQAYETWNHMPEVPTLAYNHTCALLV